MSQNKANNFNKYFFSAKVNLLKNIDDTMKILFCHHKDPHLS